MGRWLDSLSGIALNRLSKYTLHMGNITNSNITNFTDINIILLYLVIQNQDKIYRNQDQFTIYEVHCENSKDFGFILKVFNYSTCVSSIPITLSFGRCSLSN